ncbi:hypothetical protein SDC9_64383 [bioreactor metagenome]|uniref:Uncharacterized protein n=1 Tax=bioreactor metagenome TaxID=1076179 RepID=A0A644XP54_9ZZZZ
MSVSGAVVKDDNLHRRPKRAPVTLSAACGFRGNVDSVIRLSTKTSGTAGENLPLLRRQLPVLHGFENLPEGFPVTGEGLENFRREMAGFHPAVAPGDDLHRLFVGEGGFVSPARTEGVVYVRKGGNLSFPWNLPAFQSPGVAASVPFFMVGKTDPSGHGKPRRVAENISAPGRMTGDDPELLGGKFSGFRQDLPWDLELADIVQPREEGDFLLFRLAPAQFSGEDAAIFPDAGDVALRLVVVDPRDELEFFRKVGIGRLHLPAHLLAVDECPEVRCHRNEGFDEEGVLPGDPVEGDLQDALLLAALEEGNEDLALHRWVDGPGRRVPGNVLHPQGRAGQNAFGGGDAVLRNGERGELSVVAARRGKPVVVSFHRRQQHAEGPHVPPYGVEGGGDGLVGILAPGEGVGELQGPLPEGLPHDEAVVHGFELLVHGLRLLVEGGELLLLLGDDLEKVPQVAGEGVHLQNEGLFQAGEAPRKGIHGLGGLDMVPSLDILEPDAHILGQGRDAPDAAVNPPPPDEPDEEKGQQCCHRGRAGNGGTVHGAAHKARQGVDEAQPEPVQKGFLPENHPLAVVGSKEGPGSLGACLPGHETPGPDVGRQAGCVFFGARPDHRSRGGGEDRQDVRRPGHVQLVEIQVHGGEHSFSVHCHDAGEKVPAELVEEIVHLPAGSEDFGGEDHSFRQPSLQDGNNGAVFDNGGQEHAVDPVGG